MIEEKFIVPRKLALLSYVLMAVGLVSFIAGFVLSPARTWANYLLNNYYFVSLAIGAAFFISLQYISQSGWSAAFKRIPEAMAAYLPFGAVFFVLLVFGVHHLYEWSHEEAVATDPLIAHKAPYLNTPFFLIRIIAFFGLWILLTKMLRRASLREMPKGELLHFIIRTFVQNLHFRGGDHFSAFSIDMLLSLEVHWFSTIYAAKMFVSAFFMARRYRPDRDHSEKNRSLKMLNRSICTTSPVISLCCPYWAISPSPSSC